MAVPSLSADTRLAKQQARAAALDQRRAYAGALVPAARAALEDALAQQVLPHLLGGRIIAAYHPMKDEISPYPILDRLDGKQVVVFPWFADRDSRMIFRKAPATELGPWGILQPSGSAEALAPDVLLVPLVAADRLGNRLGHGKGHYDRAIAHVRQGGRGAFAIGLAWEPQVSGKPFAPETFDMPLDAIATPAEWIDCASDRSDRSGMP